MPGLVWALPLALLLALWVAVGSLQAAEGDTRTGLYVGTTRFVAPDASSFGTSFGGYWAYEFRPETVLTIGGDFATTDGSADSGGTPVAIYAQTSTLRVGATRYFGNGPLVVPFLSGGVSLVNYDVDYTFTGSALGKTAGTALGLYGDLGTELRMTRYLTVTPRFGFSFQPLSTQGGTTEVIFSTGLVFGFRIST